MESGSVINLLQEVEWEILQMRSKYKIITTFYKMEHNTIYIQRCLVRFKIQRLHYTSNLLAAFLACTAAQIYLGRSITF